MKLKMLFISAFCAAALSACTAIPSLGGKAETSAAAQTEAEASSQEADKESSETESVQASSDFQILLDLMGKHDSQVVSVLGDGEAMENEGVILSRDYVLPVFDENASVTLSFNLYQSEQDLLEQCTIRLEKQSLEEYKAVLEKELGQPTETYEKSYYFAAEGSTVVLADPFDDGPYIEISLNSEAE